MNHIRIQIAAAAIAALATATSAHAGWTFTGNDVGNNSAGNGVTITSIGGVSALNGGTLLSSVAGTIASETTGVPGVTGASGFATSSAGTNWASTAVSFYTGPTTGPKAGVNWGYGSQSDGSISPNHAFDNGPQTDANGKVIGIGNTEAMIIGFSNAVSLNSITLGYKFNDADISVFRYTGTGAPPTTGSTSLSGMAQSGWALVGNYANLGGSAGDVNGDPSPVTDSINTGNATASYWMVSAYNSAWGSGSGLDQGNDYFKILGVGAGASCKVNTAGCSSPSDGSLPEPTSLALVAIAGLGFVGARRRVLKGSTAA